MKQLGRHVFVVLLICALISGFVLAQTRESTAIQGTVRDDAGSPLPGVAITASSPSIMGKPSAVSDKDGHYRIPSLLTGTYMVEATLSGFAPAKVEGIVLHVGMMATINLTLSQAKIETEIKVIGAAPIVDVTSSSLANIYITKDVREALPTARSSHLIINIAPGVDELSAYGGGDQVGNSWTIDGTEVSTTGFGGGQYSAPIDYDVVEETQILGLGAPAEFGGFTGTAVNIVTKSGGNMFSGDIQAYTRGNTWQSSNINASDPIFSLLGKTPLTHLIDTSVHLGGPILKDKLWFFGGFEYSKTSTVYESLNRVVPTTFPKVFFKLSYQPTPNDRFQGLFEYHKSSSKHTKTSPFVLPEANIDRIWSSMLGNLSYLHSFSADSIIELKISAKSAPLYNTPSSGDKTTPGHLDLGTGYQSGNGSYWTRQPDHKYTFKISFSQSVNDLLGSHDFKVGSEVEKGDSLYENNAPGGFTYYDLNGESDYAVASHEFSSFSILMPSFYVQDDWRLTDSLVINPGLRYTIVRGRFTDSSPVIYKPHQGLEPRIGLVWDILKNQKTVFKVQYGKYYEGMRGYNFWEANPQLDTIYYKVPAWGTLNYWYTIPGTNLFSIDPNVKTPFMNQVVIGIEQVLGRNLSASAAFIYKKWTNFVDAVDVAATFEGVPFTDPATGKAYTVYEQTNLGTDHYLITNPKVGADIGAAYPGIVTVEPSRKYVGFQLTLNKRFADNWYFSASYTYSKEQGSYSDTHSPLAVYGVGTSGNYLNPTAQINLYGNIVIDPPHLLKIMGTYIFPWDISLSAMYQYYSGRTWTKSTYVDVAMYNLLLEPSGSERMPAANTLDLRVEKSFNFQKVKFSLMLDVFNTFNQSRQTAVNWFEGSNQGKASAVCDPRSFRLGTKITF